MKSFSDLPVSAVIPEFKTAVKQNNQTIISAAPGAGKTTLIPPALMDIFPGGIRLVEPRRAAARAAASRIADVRDELPGGPVGYAVRGERAAGKETRLLAVTPGILLKEFQNDPLLESIDALIFDEFHERSWESDLLLTLALEVQRSLRPELHIVIMSATLALEPLKKYLPDAAVIEAPGREYPIEERFVPSSSSANISNIAADVSRGLADLLKNSTEGDILVFLPGLKEINQVRELSGSAAELYHAEIRILHGSQDLKEQYRQMAPQPEHLRRLFLATNIAESSLTINGVRYVIDSGWERRMEYAPGNGISYLEYRRISRASAKQRAGRAGRTAPGIAIRLWSEHEHRNLPEHHPPEITTCDLAPLALFLADWGSDPKTLQWLTAPPAAALETAYQLLERLGAVDQQHLPTPDGREMAQLPVHPRIAAMLLNARKSDRLPTAVAIASILEERDSMRTNTADLRDHLKMLQQHPERFPGQQLLKKQLSAFFKISAKADIDPESAGILLAFAYPERIGQQRSGNSGVYRLSGGGAGSAGADDPLLLYEFIAVGKMNNSSSNSVIRLAAPIERAYLFEYFSRQITREVYVDFDPDSGKATAKEETRLGALLLESRPVSVPAGTIGNAVLQTAIKRKIALPPEKAKAANQLLNRVRFAIRSGDDSNLPDWSEGNWINILEQLTSGWLDNVKNLNDLEKLNWDAIVEYGLSREQHNFLDSIYPEFFATPHGRKIRIDYSGKTPSVSARIQELYGLDTHPKTGSRKIPLRLELLSPAQRPVQITCDLPGFWRGSWDLVRKDMRSRYPKHNWPEHPEKGE